MSRLFHSKPIPSVLLVLLITLFFNPAAGKAQGVLASPGGPAGQADADIAHLVGQLEQSALLVLLGAVVLMGIAFICSVWKSCGRLDRPQANARRSFFSLLVLLVGLSSLGSSCSVEQQAMAAQYRTAAENGGCAWSNHHEAFHNRYPANGYSHGYVPSFCKYCGQRLVNSRR